MDPILTALLSALDKGGPGYALASIFALLWWIERKDRKEAQAEERESGKRSAEGLNNAANAIGDMRIYMGLNRQDRRGAE